MVCFLEIPEIRESLEILESPQSVENKEDSRMLKIFYSVYTGQGWTFSRSLKRPLERPLLCPLQCPFKGGRGAATRPLKDARDNGRAPSGTP